MPYQLRPAPLSMVRHLDHPPAGTRITDPTDRRATIVRFTERGWERHEAAAVIVKRLEAEWGDRLGGDRLEQLRGQLKALIAALGA